MGEDRERGEVARWKQVTYSAIWEGFENWCFCRYTLDSKM